MLLQEIFTNQFEILLPEIYLSFIILISILYGSILTLKRGNPLISLTLNDILIILLFFLLLLVLNISIPSKNVLNGTFIIDDISKLIKIVLILSTIFFFCIQKNFNKNNKILSFEYLVLIIISLLGLMLLTSSYNLISVYLAIEIQSLCFYILSAYQRKSIFSSEASLKYFILGAIASGFILFGSSIVYGSTGSLNFGNFLLIFSNINEYNNITLITAVFYGFLMIIIGLFFKIGAAPFHFWVPDVYEGSSNNTTAFFSIVPKISIIGLLVRIFFDICGDISFFFETFIYICSFLSIIIGSFATLQQKNIKRLLAYSSIGHVGFILIGFVSNNVISIQNILFYVIIYIIMTLNFWTIFLSISLNKKKAPLNFLTDFTNFSKIKPIIALIIILNLFSMAGIPPLAGFFSKMFILYTAINSKIYGLSIIALLTSIISSFYYIKIIKIIYFDTSLLFNNVSQISNISSIILVFNTQIIIAFFLFPTYFLTFLEKISLSFLI
jgi:NADH-quinone oxidoreductase subunit N